MCTIKKKIELFQSWFKQKESIFIEYGYSINIISDTEQWFSMEIGSHSKAFIININLPDFAPYYSITMEIYDLEKDEPLTMVWHDSVETDILEFELEVERFFNHLITIGGKTG